MVDTTNMGKYNSGVDNDVQEFTATSNAFYSSPVYWNSPNIGPLVYIWGANDNLKAFQFTGSKFNTTPVSQGTISNSNGESNAAAAFNFCRREPDGHRDPVVFGISFSVGIRNSGCRRSSRFRCYESCQRTVGQHAESGT